MLLLNELNINISRGGKLLKAANSRVVFKSRQTTYKCSFCWI